MNVEFFNAIDLLGKQKGIPTDMILERVETALTKHIRKKRTAEEISKLFLTPQKKMSEL